jgi:hypothetical protein
MSDEVNQPAPTPVAAAVQDALSQTDQKPARPATEEELVLHSHANILENHAKVLQTAIAGGAPAGMIQLHVDAIATHAEAVQNAALDLAASRAPSVPQAPDSAESVGAQPKSTVHAYIIGALVAAVLVLAGFLAHANGAL